MGAGLTTNSDVVKLNWRLVRHPMGKQKPNVGNE